MISNKLVYSTVLIGALLVVPMAYNSCSYYNPATGKTSTLGNPKGIEKTAFAFSKYQQVSALNVCLNEMVLSTVAGDSIRVPFFPPKQIAVPLAGVELDTLLVDQGQYTKISLELADVCGGGASMQMTNSHGNFQTTAAISLKFSGNEFLGGDSRKTVFDMEALAGNLSQVTSNGMVAANAMLSTGNYHSLNCGLQSNPSNVAFCETFDKASPVVSRSGDLNSVLWNVSRLGPSNQGQGELNVWNSSTVDVCGTFAPAGPDGSDIRICNGQLRQSTNDGGKVTTLSMSPKQPFDFSGRTGTIAFDVTNDTSGSHGAWPEFWLSDQAMPVQQSFNDNKVTARNGIAIRFQANYAPFTGNIRPNCPNDSHDRWGIASIVLVKDYAVQEIGSLSGDARLQNTGCVISSEGANGGMNHIELRISQNQIEVWATDAGYSELKKIAVLKNLALPFSKGYIALSDNHNNASGSQVPEHVIHTFAWDNVAFDGPVLKRDLGFDVLNSLTANASGTLNLGYSAAPGSPAVLNTIALSAADVAAGQASGQNAKIFLNLYSNSFNPITTIQYNVNGTPLTATVPYPTSFNGNYALEVPVPASALVTGAQNLSIQANDGVVLSNVTLSLPGAGE